MDAKKCREKWLRSGLLSGLPSERDQEKIALLLDREAQYIMSFLGSTTLDQLRSTPNDMRLFSNLIFPIIRRVFRDVRFQVVMDPEVKFTSTDLKVEIPKELDMSGCINGIDAEVELCMLTAENLVTMLNINSLGGTVHVGPVPFRFTDTGTHLRLSIDAIFEKH